MTDQTRPAVNQIALFYRKSGVSVGIIAVDPSSPYSGGAILDGVAADGYIIRSFSGSIGQALEGTGRLAATLDVLPVGNPEVLLEPPVAVKLVLDRRIAVLLAGLPVVIAEDPLTCVARGGGRALELMDERGGEIFTVE